MDPLAALMLRANLSVRGWDDRSTVLVKDYREVKLPRCKGMTAFIGNPLTSDITTLVLTGKNGTPPLRRIRY